METLKAKLAEAGDEMRSLLSERVIPFWLERCEDKTYGGYLTSFDENGAYNQDGRKYIVTQSRMLWGFSHLAPYARREDCPEMERLARQGAKYICEAFWDEQYGGFYWQLNRDGSISDPAKLVYGESFAIYALSAFARQYGAGEALAKAEETFDLLNCYAADTRYGGYYENLERDFSLSPDGKFAGDRKSLDIHMHLMEAFAELCLATKQPIHARRLREVLGLIEDRMVDWQGGYGFNQFDWQFNRIPAIDIARTWNAERAKGEAIAEPVDTTSYGHNVELSWLAHLALKTLGEDVGPHAPLLRGLLDHALRHGLDREYGGVYRDGVADGEALVTDKEWWQNFESMVGFLNGYTLFENEDYAEAFLCVWRFVRDCFIDGRFGESRQLLKRDGTVLVGDLGNPWKGIYHTGRALAECIDRLGIC